MQAPLFFNKSDKAIYQLCLPSDNCNHHLDMAECTVNVDLLQAEGELNREIQSALQQFRSKLINSSSPSKKEIAAKPYESNKQGPQKIFVFRESLLSIMFEINDFRTIYNMMVASFIILTCSLFYDSYMQKGEILDMLALYKFFMGGKTVFIAWISLVAAFFLIIFITKIAIKVSYYLWVPLYIAHIAAVMSIATYFSQHEGLGFGSVIIIMAEAVRMLMKGHSYLRTKLIYLTQNKYSDFQFRGVRVVNASSSGEKKEDKHVYRINIKDQDLSSQIKKISYFLFCPTLIYRDQYTLTPVRSIRRIVIHLINFFACTYYSFILYMTWCKPVIEQLQNNLNFQTLLSAVINLMMPSVLFLIMGFFGFLHSWLNLWSQITRFPDRAFYADWWNSCEFGSYYRKWNIVVHDWLYYYIYLDLCRFFPSFKKFRAVPQLLTFISSAIIHEVIIYYAIGFFYPILFLLFAGPGILFVQSQSLRKTSVNLIFWLEMYIGTSMMFSFYLIQCFARNKITTEFIEEKWGSLGIFIPRTLYLGN